MAGEIPDLHAEVRTGTGKGAARQVRRENYVPGIVYGGDQPPLPIKLPYNALLKKLKEGRFLATLFNLKIEGQDDVRVICRKVERHVVKDLPTHVDLMGILDQHAPADSRDPAWAAPMATTTGSKFSLDRL